MPLSKRSVGYRVIPEMQLMDVDGSLVVGVVYLC